MIVVDMDMPKACVDCKMYQCSLYGREWFTIDGDKSYQTARDKRCLIKCDIEDIKVEIESARYGLINDGLDLALKIIDKHIKQ